MAQSIFLNTMIAVAGRGLTLACGLAATALMVRLVTVEQFGTYSLLLTIGTFLQLAADFGLYLTASKELGGHSGEKSVRIQSIVSLRLILLGITTIIGVGILAFIPSLAPYNSIFIVIMLGLCLQSLSQLSMSVFQASGQVWKATAGDVGGRLLQVALLAVAYLSHEGSLSGIAQALSVGLAASFFIHLIMLPDKTVLRPRISRAQWKSIAKNSWPLALMLVLNVLYFRIDMVMLSFFRSATEVGWYALAYKIIENGLFFPAMVGGLLLPHFSDAIHKKNTFKLEQLLSEGLTLSIAVAAVCSGSLVVFSKDIVQFIGGNEFVHSSGLLSILSLALAIMFVGNIFGFVLVALSEQKKLMYLYAGLLVGTIGANALTIPFFGAWAAAWVTVAIEAMSTSIAFFFVRRHVHIQGVTRPAIRAIGLAGAAVLLGAVMPNELHILVRIGFVGVVYGLLGLVCGLWSPSSFTLLHSSRSI